MSSMYSWVTNNINYYIGNVSLSEQNVDGYVNINKTKNQDVVASDYVNLNLLPSITELKEIRNKLKQTQTYNSCYINPFSCIKINEALQKLKPTIKINKVEEHFLEKELQDARTKLRKISNIPVEPINVESKVEEEKSIEVISDSKMILMLIKERMSILHRQNYE
jgi:hypothetical protein